MRARPLCSLALLFLFPILLPTVSSAWVDGGLPVSAVVGDQQFTIAVSDGAGGAFVAWTDDRNGLQAFDIYAQRVDGDGNPLWAENGVPVCTATDWQAPFEMVADGSGGAIFVWVDQRAGENDLYAQRKRRVRGRRHAGALPPDRGGALGHLDGDLGGLAKR